MNKVRMVLQGDKQLNRWSQMGYKRVLMFGQWWDISESDTDRYHVHIRVDFEKKQVIREQIGYN